MDISTVWLKERNGQRAFFPDSNNTRFLFSGDVGSICFPLDVEGSPAPKTIGTRSSSPHLITSPRNPLVAHTRKAGPVANVQVVQASVFQNRTGKIEFSPQSSSYFELTETNANVQFLTNAVQAKWGSDQVIVSSDGLPRGQPRNSRYTQ